MLLTLHLAFVAAVIAQTALGQLHLIAGTPTDPSDPETTFASNLYRVQQDGSLFLASELVPKKVGIHKIELSYSHRAAAIESNDSLIVVDFDRATVVKTCPTPSVEGESRLNEWLAESNTLGLAWEFYTTPSDLRLSGSKVHGLSLDPSLPCNKSLLAANPNDVKNSIINGRPGVAGSVPYRNLNVGVVADNSLQYWVGMPVLSGYRLPTGLFSDVSRPHVGLYVNDAVALALAVCPSAKNCQVLVLRKRDGLWRVLPVKSELAPEVRGFGRFLAATEVRAKTGASSTDAEKQGWREEPSTMGPSVALIIRNAEEAFPGRLHLFDTETESTFTIDTGQSDSEVLLVEASTVYYRVNDRLYVSTFSATGIGPARLLATDDIIRDAHWAFMKR